MTEPTDQSATDTAARPGLPAPVAGGSGDQPFPSRRSLRAQASEVAASLPSPDTSSVSLPAVVHDPSRALTETREEKVRPSLGRRLYSLAAAIFAGALACSAIVPFATSMTASTTASAANQELVNAGDPNAAVPDSFENVDVSVVDENSVNRTFTYRPNALMNFPIMGTVALTGGFGYRTEPFVEFHGAQDLAAPGGTPIQAIADGTVLEAGWAEDGCGFSLKLEHEVAGDEFTSRYCHMTDGSHNLSPGDTVKMGEQIGAVGTTGLSLGNHLHLVIEVDEEPVDPMQFITVRYRETGEKSEHGTRLEGE